MRDAGGDLDDGRAGQELEDEGPRRGPALGVEDASAGAAAGGIGEDRAEAADVEGRRVGDLDGPGQPEGVEVGLREGDAQRVEVHARGRQAGPGEGQQVPADAAPQVDDAGRSGGREARGAVLGHPEPGRLLEGVGGEEHERGEVPELRDRPRAELHLRGGRRRPVGVGLEPADGGRDPDRVTAVLDPCAGRLLQQPTAGIGLQPGQRLEVHAGILSGGSVPLLAPDVAGSPPCASC